MTTFEDKLQASAQRLTTQDNKRLSVPQNPLSQKKSYWGRVATPAAAIIGLILGMSMHLLVDNEPDGQYAHHTDTVRIFHPVHDTLYLTQVVEKKKVVVRQVAGAKTAGIEGPKGLRLRSKSGQEAALAVQDSVSTQEETDTPQCTSVQCDGINYAILALN